ncbi:MAG: polysaccharide deacetylase family protein [Chloroflexi bacterium]|nr:polysaccharide deacetylase family protein [Chloroflexota bacterium]
MIRTAATLMLSLPILLAVACTGGAPAPAATPSPTITGPPSTPTSTATADATTTTPAVPTATPPPMAEARVVYRGDPSRRAVALTFDAGSDAGYTADILRILRDNNVRATFGVTGVWAEQNRDLLFAVAADGHPIINHTYDHRSFTGVSTGDPPLTPDERALELSRAEVTVYRYTSRSTKPYFRPPYGDIDAGVLRDAAASGYGTVVMWTVDTLGWNGATAAQILQRSRGLAEPGAIYVMHVGSDSQDAAALQPLIDALRADNYTFETIDELLTP